jgi:hypothetical protein
MFFIQKMILYYELIISILAVSTMPEQGFKWSDYKSEVKALRIGELTYVDGVDTNGKKRNQNATLLSVVGVLTSIHHTPQFPHHYKLTFITENGERFTMVSRSD